VTNVFSTPETSVHVLDKNREISPLERERKVTGERIDYGGKDVVLCSVRACRRLKSFGDAGVPTLGIGGGARLTP